MISIKGSSNLELRGFCIAARCYLPTKLASPCQSGTKFACEEFKKNLNGTLHIFLFSEFGDVIMITLVISLMVPYSGTCFVLYLLLIRTLVITAHV